MAHGRVVLAATLGTALVLLLAASSAAHAVKEGGTFRMAVPAGWFDAVDPARTGLTNDILRPACAALMSYPNKPLPAGLRTAPELARSHPTVSRNGRTYTLTLRADARFSTGASVTARDVVHSLERVFTPSMESPAVEFLGDIVGASEMLSGKATSLRGVTAKGLQLTFRLTRRAPSFPARLGALCVAPANLPIDPEGAKAPIPSPAPYYVSEYEPGVRAVLERNRFYRGSRPHHVDRITIELEVGVEAVGRVMRGELDHVFPAPDLNGRLPEIARRYGVNRSRFFVEPGTFTRMFFLNTSRPLFKDNVKLRQAVNFAVDRKALTREIGPHVATATDQYLPTALAGFRDARIYPLDGPDLRRARALAKGRTRSGKAVLYTCNRPDCVAPAQILQRNLEPIGISVTIRKFPTALLFEKIFRPREPFDIAWIGWGDTEAAAYLTGLFHGSSGSNLSRFNDPTYNRLFERASQLPNVARYRAFGDLDVRLARDAAPAIGYATLNAWAVVSARTGCVVMNPFLDLTAVCLK
jgi:oligopeptide transport system substrate-binding protein